MIKEERIAENRRIPNFNKTETGIRKGGGRGGGGEEKKRRRRRKVIM